MSYRTILLFGVITLGACGGTETGIDGGTDGSSNDATGNDGAPSDASSDTPVQDVVGTDSPASDGGGLGLGAVCDPKDDQCKAGLKCCPGGTIILDGGNNYHCMMETTMGTCPIVP